MLKKYKILLALIVLTATGITLVLSFWLYGSYKSERELFLGRVERGLFNVLQNYYQNDFIASEKKAKKDSSDTERRHRGFLAMLTKVYPDLDVAPMQTFLDTADFRRGRNRRMREDEAGKEAPNELLPLYLLEKIDFNTQLLDTLEIRLEKALAKNNIPTTFQLSTAIIHRDDFDAYMQYRRKQGNLYTRPILINPESEQFLLAKFDNPWSYLGVRLSGQLFLSLLLLTALLGTFLYLFKTIKRQNQEAVLRKAFVNNMTHELKTPVATVMAAVEAIQRFVAKDDKVKMNKYLDLSKTELEHLNNMIERVLQLDVDETHRIRISKSEFDMIPLIHNCLELTTISATKKIRTAFDHADGKLLVMADEAHLKNVVSNLLDNAIKYSSDPAEIHIVLKADKDKIHLSISDRGKGIAPEHLPHIFAMFYRVPQGTLHEVKGFGLGLAYVKHVVEQHGGNITVGSELGKGSIFTIEIPKS
ncbi:sensor histidine kinase [Sphingobacterium paludis]|uniref:histidine kinase n=1 Tax=Sphingobacterium paludis TaxID=1476465 RepID=A0A4R7CSM5_9SPHI|nr:ATP-binding protein [Sphingobacterium paludis]TDS08431.1 phospho-acceptor domain-containing protein [Sphingobacterium paludis]